MGKSNRLSGSQWAMLIIESLGWSGVMVMGYFISSYYALIQDVFQYDAGQMASLLAIWTSVGAICYLFGGLVADLVKPKINLAISYLGLTLCGAMVLVRPSYGIMQILTILMAVFGLGTFTSAMLKYVASLGSREQMPRIYGYFYALAAAEGLVIAPISSAIIERSGSYSGLRAIVIFFCAMMLVSMLLHFVLVERKTNLVQEDKGEEDKFSFRAVLDLLKNPNMYFVLIIGWLTCLPYDLNTYVQPILASEFGASQGLVAMVAAYANNGTALVMAPLAGIIAAKLGSTAKVMVLSMVLAIVSTGALLLTPWNPSYLVLAVVIIFALRCVFSVGKPARNSMIGESRLPKRARGTAIGLMFAVNNLISSGVALLSGNLVTQYGVATGYRIIYAGAVALFAMGLVVSLIFSKRLKKAKERDAIEGVPEDLMV